MPKIDRPKYAGLFMFDIYLVYFQHHEIFWEAFCCMIGSDAR